MRDGQTVLANDRALGAICEFGGCFREGRNTGDPGVLLVERLGDGQVLGRANGRKNVRLPGVVAVGTDAEIDFALEGIGLVGFGDTDDGILRGPLALEHFVALDLGLEFGTYWRALRNVRPG